MFSQWRDCQGYRDLGLPLSTTSNEAVKLYDASATQFLGFYNDPNMGGLDTTMKGMFQADPNFVMAYVMKNALSLFRGRASATRNPNFKSDMDTMVTLSNSPHVNHREKLYVQAIQCWEKGDLISTCEKLDEILMDNPTDVFGIKLIYFLYLFMGRSPEARDCLARCLAQWKESTPLYGYLLGMYSFGLEETNLYRQAEKFGRKALLFNPADGWAVHSLVHVMEMEGRDKEGIEFLGATVNDWTKCQMLSGHNFWHWAVFNVERNDHQAALDLYDSEVSQRFKDKSALANVPDVCSILYRLEMEGVNVGDRWKDVLEGCRPQMDDHNLSYSDVHLMMAFVKDDNGTAQKMIDSLKEFVRNGCGYNQKITKELGLPICEAIMAYENGDYGTAVELLYPIRYDIVKIGGSNAQRDIFNLLLIHAAMKSPEKRHQKLARHLLNERKAIKENSPLTDRLIAKFLEMHSE